MSELYCVEVRQAPDKENRFAICFSSVFSNLSDIQFVKLGKAIIGSRSQGFRARHNLDFCKHIVDSLHQAVKGGSPQKWLASARVSRFVPTTSQLESVYTGVEQVAAIVDNSPSLIRLAFDGTYRKIPDVFQRMPRGWKYPFSILADSNGIPRADWFQAPTKKEIVDQIFDPNYQLARDVVVSYPLADPSEIPEPPAPVAEFVPTQAELNAVEPLNYSEWQRLPSEEHKRRYVFDPLYRAAFEKMLTVQAVAEQKFAEKQAKEKEAEDIEKLKKQILSADEDERRKGAHL